MSDKNPDWEYLTGRYLGKVRELKSELRTALSALSDLRELTKASTHHTTEAGSPDYVLFHLPKDGGMRTRGIAILERVDKILGKVEPEKA